MNKLDVIIREAYEIAYQSPEINMNNYSIEEVERLNDAMIAVFLLLEDAKEVTGENT